VSLELQGLGVSNGIAIGHALILFHNQPDVREYLIPHENVEAEVQRLQRATQLAKDQLLAIRSNIPSNAPTDVSAFIDTYLLMLQDSSLTTIPTNMIRQRRCNAEWALQLQRDALINVFDEMDDPYLRTRRDDVDHVVNRIHRLLADEHDHELDTSNNRLKGAIIIAEDLTPADTMFMQHQGIAAFVTEHGGATSHTTILARSLGIPAIVGIGSLRRYIQDNEPLIINGKTGILIASSPSQTVSEYKQHRINFEQYITSLSHYKSQPTQTRDGEAITLLANAESSNDIPNISQSGAQGIGLYRTEFLYMNRTSPPDEEEQFQVYRQAVEGMNNQPVTIRTFDLGADKTVGGGRNLNQTSINPALGLRAIRLCLKQPSMFRAQLRAILRASAFGEIKIMFPMIANEQELRQAKQALQHCKDELIEEKILFDPHIQVGVMIEVPASAICADFFAQETDFLSIGTNDLIQYTLAADRVDDHVNYLYNPLHPAVLSLIQITLDAGKKHAAPVSMCGEMASDPLYTRLLLAMGLKQFSMHPSALLEIKKVINDTHLNAYPENVLSIFTLSNPMDAEHQLEELNHSATQLNAR